MVKLNEIEKLICDMYGLGKMGLTEQAMFLLGMNIGIVGTDYLIKNGIENEGAVTSFNHCRQIAGLVKTGKICKKAYTKLQEISKRE